MVALDEMLGESLAMVGLRAAAAQLVRRGASSKRLPPVLIEGETGTGKGLLARGLHQAGPRSGRPFVHVNCAAIPETLLEAELFGFERGAFTDARHSKLGLFQTAHQGTLLLDEIGLLPLRLQAKLLTVVEEGVVRRLGATQTEVVDAWILTATNEDLSRAVREHRFREDLYHRLAVMRFTLPPLRERRDDVATLARHFLAQACVDYALPPKELSQDALSRIRTYDWPGNVRELANVIERATVLCEGPVVTSAALNLGTDSLKGTSGTLVTAPSAAANSGQGTGERLREVLARTAWNISRTARELGVSRNTVYAWIGLYGIRRDDDHSLPFRSRKTPRSAAPAALPEAQEGAVAAIRWEVRWITLLSVRVNEPSAPEGLFRRTLQVVEAKLRTFGGRIEEMGPTGFTAAFGLEPVEATTNLGVHAALAIKRGVERAPVVGDQMLVVRIAIHRVRARVGMDVGPPRLDAAFVHQAWRALDDLLEACPPGEILVSADTSTALAGRFELVPMDSASPYYRLIPSTRSEPRLATPRRRFVGRQVELELLQSRLDAARHGQGQVVGVMGDAGIGKSRLLEELLLRLEGDEVTVLEGRCLAFATAVPYFSVLEIVRSICGLSELDAPGVVADKVRTTHNALGLGSEASVSYLLHLLGVKDDTASVERRGADVIRGSTFEAIRQLVLRASRRQLVVILVEDLHWSDSSSEAFLDFFVHSVARARILLAMTYRAGYRPAWGDRPNVTQIGLLPLLQSDAIEVVREVFGSSVPSDVAELILSKAEGNPLFLEEFARAVRDRESDPAAPGVPATVQDLLAARMRRLEAEPRQVLFAAAIIGRNVPLALFCALTDLTEDAARAALNALERSGFFVQAGAEEEAGFTFKHPLMHEVAYEGLGQAQRRILHARVVDAIESLYAGRTAEHVDRLAHHAFQGELWEKAVSFSRQAGSRAMARSALREAVTLFEQALIALGHLPPTPVLRSQQIDILFDLRHALIPLGEYARIRAHLREAEQLAEALEDQRRLGWISCYVNNYCWLVAEHERGLESGRRALALADTGEDSPLRIAATVRLAQTYHALGDYRQSVVLTLEVLGRIADNREHEYFGLPGPASVWARAWLTWSLAELGEFGEGVTHGEEAMRIADSIDHGYSILIGATVLGLLHLRQGDAPRAMPLFERALSVCTAGDFLSVESWIVSALSDASILAGRGSELLPVLETAIEDARAKAILWSHSGSVAALAALCMAADRRADAVRLARESLELARLRRERGHEAWSLRLLAEVCSSVGRLEEAAQLYSEASGIGAELGMQPLVAHCRFGRAALFNRVGRHDESRAQCEAAAAEFLRLGMSFWVMKANAELIRLGGS